MNEMKWLKEKTKKRVRQQSRNIKRILDEEAVDE